MKRRMIVWAAVIGAMAASPVSFSVAQEGATGAATPGIVVVLDVARVFKENPGFNKKIEAIQAKAKTLKTEVESKQQALQDQAKMLNEKWTMNAPERKTGEAQLEQEMTTLRTYARQSEAELMTEEAKVYYDTYQAMQSIVARAATANNISLVLRFDSSECEQNNRGDVIKMVNRAIVFQSNSDITDWVIGEMEKVETAAAGAAGNR